jgi:hypothetical protein
MNAFFHGNLYISFEKLGVSPLSRLLLLTYNKVVIENAKHHTVVKLLGANNKSSQQRLQAKAGQNRLKKTY